ncbi:MAG: CPBP family intramembrane metalloprotease [Ruminococcus sp.]|nr:CPBP family intramembrane metalloprotease [Ruminococcus sp.]
MYYDPNDPQQALYNTVYAQAVRNEKRAMFIGCAKLGALLLIYNILTTYVFRYIYYAAVASVHSGRVYLLPSQSVGYLAEQEELIYSTSFAMGGNLAIVAAGVITLLLIARFAMRVDMRELLHPEGRHIGQAFKWLPLCVLLNTVISIGIGYLESYLSSYGVTLPDADFSISRPTTLALVLQFSYVIVIGPIAEELIYRGLILTLLKPYGRWLAVFFSALFFGIMHGNIPQAVSAFGSALVMGAVAIRCNSIVPTIIIHIFNNVIASYYDFADVIGWGYSDEIFMVIQILVFLIGSFVLLVYGWQITAVKDGQCAMPIGQRLGQVFKNPLIIAYLVYELYFLIRAIVEANR